MLDPMSLGMAQLPNPGVWRQRQVLTTKNELRYETGRGKSNFVYSSSGLTASRYRLLCID